MSAIDEAYVNLGGEAGRLGKPTEDELANADGTGSRRRFERCYIFWHPEVGAHPVFYGQIFEEWKRQGREGGRLGYPAESENEAGLAYGNLATYGQKFQQGSIFWTPGTPAATVLKRPARLKIWIDKVRCYDTEDHTNADDFYLTWTVVDGESGEARSGITSKMSINDGETEYLPQSERVIFNGEVTPSSRVAIALVAYDEDTASDYEKTKREIAKVPPAIREGFEKIKEVVLGDGWARELVDLAERSLKWVVSQDVDDKLGTLGAAFTPGAMPWGTNRHTWKFSYGGTRPFKDYDDYRYQVDYIVELLP